MAGGVRGPTNPSYSQTEYSQPWGGIDVSKPSSQIDPGSAVSLTGTIIRGGLTGSPNIAHVTSSVPVTVSAFESGELVMLMSNLMGVSVLITNVGVYTDTASSSKAFIKVFTFPAPYNVASYGFGSVTIGNALYFSSAQQLGVYKLLSNTVTEITAQNGSGPFIGGSYVGTIAQRLVLGNIVGGDGNQTGGVNSVTITNGGTGYPASGVVAFTGGGGQNAAGTFTSTGGVITSITITAAGTGYLTGPTPSLITTTGTGFTGTTAITGAATPSTNTHFPDYFAWSFPSAFGSFDPNSISLGGGFDQLTEARGLITGLAIFEAVCFIAHNGGFTEATPNTTVGNIEPFTFNPLWSADQGVVCRQGSMAQYGAMVCFLGYDQPYQLSPSGLTPFGDQISSLVQNLSYWPITGFLQSSGIFGSIVEIEGEKHYLIVFASYDDSFGSTHPLDVFSYVYDANLKTNSWTTWFYQGLFISAPIYQSYDSQEVAGVYPFAVNDNWLLVATNTSSWISSGGNLGQVLVGQQLYNSTASTFFPGSLNVVFRTETPAMAIPQTTRRLLVEYENLPVHGGLSPQIGVTLFGQPEPDSTGAQAPISNTATVVLPNFALSETVIPNAVLTVKAEMQGTALTTSATTLQIQTTTQVRLIRVALIAETTKSELQ